MKTKKKSWLEYLTEKDKDTVNYLVVTVTTNAKQNVPGQPVEDLRSAARAEEAEERVRKLIAKLRKKLRKAKG